MTWIVEGIRQRGCPKKTWWDCVKDDIETLGLSQKDVQSRNKWRRRIKGEPANPSSSEKMAIKTACVLTRCRRWPWSHARFISWCLWTWSRFNALKWYWLIVCTANARHASLSIYLFVYLFAMNYGLHCFDTVLWVLGMASSM